MSSARSGSGTGSRPPPPRAASGRATCWRVLVARRGRPVPAEVVLDLVWGDAATALTPAAVHTVVARLRRQFGDGLVRTTDAGYVVPVDVGLDAERFTALAAEGSEGDDEVGRCREAVALWSGGTAYAGVRDDLVMAERVRLEELLRRVRGDLAAALLAPGAPQDDVAEAMGIAAGLVTEHPLDEGAAVLAMRAADRLQRQGEALEVFARLRDRLREELGVDPGPVAVAAHARILARDAETAGPGGRSAGPPRTSPAGPGVADGRSPGRRWPRCSSALREGRRLVTVTGPGGVGKSRLLADVGAALATDHDVVHVALSGHQAGDAQDLASALAVTTGCRSPPTTAWRAWSGPCRPATWSCSSTRPSGCSDPRPSWPGPSSRAAPASGSW